MELCPGRHLEHPPALPAPLLGVRPGAPTAAGPPLQHSCAGLRQSPLHGSQPAGAEQRPARGPKCRIDWRPSALILKCLPAAAGV